MNYLAVCAIVKDEDLYLREWAAYHAGLGVEHFYIYDNGSRRHPARSLEGFEAARFTFVRWPGVEQQMPAYNHCLKEFGPDCRWLAFIDVDEFICPKHDDDICSLLAEYEDYAGLAIPWVIFGSNGYLRRPEGLVIENYREALPEEHTFQNNTIKCIVNPAQIVKMGDPHRAVPELGRAVVGEDHNPIPSGANRVIRHLDKVQLNHYFYRSQEEYEAKLARGRADRADAKAGYGYAPFYNQAQAAVYTDDSIQRFVQATRQVMAKPQLLPAAQGCLVDFHSIVDPVMNLLAQKKFSQAERTLCATAEASKHYAEFWVMRSMIARCAGQLQRALRYAYKALYFNEIPESYWAVLESRLALGQMEEARKTSFCLKALLNSAKAAKQPGVEEWRAKLEQVWQQHFEAAAPELCPSEQRVQAKVS